MKDLNVNPIFLNLEENKELKSVNIVNGVNKTHHLFNFNNVKPKFFQADFNDDSFSSKEIQEVKNLVINTEIINNVVIRESKIKCNVFEEIESINSNQGIISCEKAKRKKFSNLNGLKQKESKTNKNTNVLKLAENQEKQKSIHIFSDFSEISKNKTQMKTVNSDNRRNKKRLVLEEENVIKTPELVSNNFNTSNISDYSSVVFFKINNEMDKNQEIIKYNGEAPKLEIQFFNHSSNNNYQVGNDNIARNSIQKSSTSNQNPDTTERREKLDSKKKNSTSCCIIF